MKNDSKSKNKISLLKILSSLVVFFLVIPAYANYKPTNSTPKIGAKYACSAAVNETTIQPLRSGNWNTRSIWPGNTRPTLNDHVLIPEGINITPFGNINAKSITIKGTMKAVKNQESAAWFNMNTEYIMVMGPNALFEIGTENQYYKSNSGATITLLGQDPNKLIPGTAVNSKGIMVMDGATFEMHGKPKVSWTQLGATIAAGSNIIQLKEPVNWEVGDQIVVASTDFDMNKAETRTIVTVNSSTNFTLDNPFEYKHFGDLQEYTHGKDSSISWTLDERAEVGLLSHNIRIRGDDTSLENGFGGHMMCMPGAKMKASNIELYHMGQKGILGRYPWHWHLLQEGGTGLYLKNSSIHNTFNRAVTIHGTNNTNVEKNVAYDNLGHAYFFEDGNEINNTMQYNLGLVTRRPKEEDALLPSDLDNERNMSGPATFWITHPHNKINFNHAAGSDGSGIWFAPHQNRNSAIHNPDLNPSHIPVPDGNWDNNVAHSSTHGLLVGPTVFPHDRSQNVNPNLDYYDAGAPSDEVIQVKNYTLYKNLLASYMRIGQNKRTSRWENFIIADNYKGEALTWDGDMYRFLWVGGSDNYEEIPEDAGAVGGAAGLVHLHTIYDGPSRVHDSHFAGVLPQMSLFDQWGANIKYVGHTLTNTTVAENSFYINWRDINNRPVWENATVVDTDGVFTGLEPLTVMHKGIPILSNENTTFLENSNGAISSPLNKYCYVEILPSDEIIRQQKRQRSTFTRSDGAVQQDNTVEIQGISLVPMVNGQYTYQLGYENSIPAISRMNYYSMDQGDDVIIGYPAMPTTAVAFERDLITDGITPLPLRVNLAELKNTSGSAYAFDKDVLYVKYVAPEGSKFDDLGFVGRIDVCLYGNCEAGDNIAYADTDGDTMFDYLEIDNCRNPESAKDLNFEFNKSTEKFKTNDVSINNSNSEENWLIRADFKMDPYVYREGFAIDGNDLNTLRIRVLCTIAGVFELFWANEDGTYSLSRSLKLDYQTPGEWQELVFNLEGHPAWSNKTISGLRLDFPVDVSKRVRTQIDYIKGVQEAGIPKLAQFIAKVGNPLARANTISVCEGDSVLFDFLGAFTSDWSFAYTSPAGEEIAGGSNREGVDQLLISNVLDNGMSEGIWEVVYTNPNGCSNTAQFEINVNTNDILRQFSKVDDLPLEETSNLLVAPGSRVLFDMLGAFSQDWNFTYTRPDGQVFPGGTNGSDNDQILIQDTWYGSINEGEWLVTYTNPAGCTNTSTFNLQIDVTLTSENAISKDKGIKVYPNPAKEYVLLYGFNFQTNSIIELYNSIGKLIYRHKVSATNNQKIDLRSVASGIYFLRFNIDNKSHGKKIVICK